MPGIVGLVSEMVDTQIFESMYNALRHFDFHDVYLYESSVFSAALVSNGVFSFCEQPLRKDNIVLFFDGELYNNFSGFSDTEFVLENYLKFRSWIFLKDLKGIFSFCAFDIKNRKLYLGVDKFGLKTIYYSSLSKEFLFSSELKAFVKHPRFPKFLDYKTLANFFHFSFALGDRTLFKSAKLLPSATVLEYDFLSGKLSFFRYWDDLFLFTPRGEHKGIHYMDLCLLFEKSVKQRLKYKEDIGIALSGGLDSRSILAALREEAFGMFTYTLGLPGCRDERCAAQMAHIMGTNHHFVSITKEKLLNFIIIASDLNYYSDGFYFPTECTEKFALDYFLRKPFRFLIRGHGGELLKCSLAFPVKVNKILFDHDKDPSKISDILFSNTNIVLQDISSDFIFAQKDLLESYQEIFLDLRRFVQKYFEFLLPADIFMYFFLREYIRRQTVSSLNIFRQSIEIRLPFLDEDFLKSVFVLLPQKRYKGEIQKYIINYFAPILSSIPDSNTGVPLNANRIYFFIGEKFNELAKRCGVKGFRSYVDHAKWYRTYFKNDIKDILFDPKTVERGFYKSKNVEKIFEMHMKKKKDFSRLLSIIIGIELWLRKFVD